MRLPRWKAPSEHSAGYYHCVSRVVDRRFAFGVPEREQFRQFLSEYAAFCGVRVLTWCILSNHFHLLLEVPRKPDVAPPLAELIPRLQHLSSSTLSFKAAQLLLEGWLASGNTESPEELRQRLWAQMYDLSAFMKLLKQRFTQWFNGMHERRGTLWEERFRSALLEGSVETLVKNATYIDLNAVRAGMVDDPKDYRWCGYAEALAGKQDALAGLATCLGVSQDAVLAAYRQRLYIQGEEREGTDEQGRPLRKGFDRAQVLQVLADGGQLPTPELYRLKIRYLVDGAVLGSKAFVNDIFNRHRDRFGPKRQDGARPARGLPGLCTLRALRLRVIT